MDTEENKSQTRNHLVMENEMSGTLKPTAMTIGTATDHTNEGLLSSQGVEQLRVDWHS
jgi:hypothetical protein